MPGLPDVGGKSSQRQEGNLPFCKEAGDCRKEQNMAKNRVKQRAHLRCGMTKEERLQKEAKERQEEEIFHGLWLSLSDDSTL